MKRVGALWNCPAIICLLVAILLTSLPASYSTASSFRLSASGQVSEKQAAKPREAVAKDQTKERTNQGKLSGESGENKESNETDEQASIRARQQKIQLMVEETIARLSQIEPIETRILAHVETAATLWKYDRPKAYQLIKQGIELLDGLYREKMGGGLTADLKTIKAEREARERFIRVIIRKIAALDASLAANIEKDRKEKKEDTKIEYSEAAQAVMDNAVSLAKEDPIRAAQMARDSLSQGTPYNTIAILFALQSKDKTAAEKLATDFIKHFQDVPYSVANLNVIAQYVFLEDGPSEQLRDLYFKVFASRLRNDLLLDPTPAYLNRLRSSLTANLRLAAKYPKAERQFEELRAELENYFPVQQPETSQPAATPEAIDMSDLLPAKEGDTQSIKDAQAKAAMLIDPYQRDKEYGRLAASAAQKADQSLAEEILNKIKDDRIRSAASMGVYGPLIRKALVEKDWNRAQYLSTKVTDPLGRSFALIDVASEMSVAKIEKDAIIRFYAGGLNQLQADPESLNVAKAYLALVNPLLPLDSRLALNAARGAVRCFNNSKPPRPHSSDAQLERGAAVWGQRAREELGATQEMFEPSDVLPKIFRALASREPIESQTLADQISDRGLQTFAQLGIISRELAEQSKTRTQQKARDDSPSLSKPKEKQP